MVPLTLAFSVLLHAATAQANIVFHWDPPDSGVDDVTHYRVHCLPDDAPLRGDAVDTIGRVPATEQKFLVIDQLPVGNKYHCGATSEDEATGELSELSNIVVVDLSAGLPPPPTTTTVECDALQALIEAAQAIQQCP